MLEKIFLQILNMSFTASFVIILVLIARQLLKRSPKILSYALWGVVLFRLICPFSFESMFSLLPAKTNPISQDIVYAPIPTIDTGIPAINHTVNQLLPAATPDASVNPLQIWVFIGSAVWLMGIAVLLIYSIFSLVKLQKRLKNAAHEKDNIYLAEHLDTPFVMGIIRPKIYLPASLTEGEKRYILLHEQMHIRRFDHVVKIISFFTLCLHWFNPLVWIAFFISGKDMEMSCDEAVIKQLGSDVKKEYSSSLLTLATGKRIIGGSPLAFGEGDTKGRIKNVLNYKKYAFGVVALSLIIVVVLGIALATNQKSERSFKMSGNYLSDLQPGEIVKDITKIIKVDNGDINISPDNFGLTVSSDFSWVNDEAIRILFAKNEKHWNTSQLRIFIDDFEFFVTEPSDWVAYEGQVFSLQAYLEALKYLPQKEIALLCTENPQKYAIELSENDRKLNADRCIYYGKSGVTENNGWKIRLDIQPLYGDNDLSLSGVGSDIIHVFYNDSVDPIGTPAETIAAEYLMMKLGKNGEVISEHSLQNELAEAIIMDYMLKSAAWEGMDISTLDESYLIRQTFSETGEIHDYYAYRLEDGKAALQAGTDGRYSILSEEFYVQLVASSDSEKGLFFWIKPDESPQVIGETAATVWLNSFMETDTPAENRISDYTITDVTVIAGEPKQGMKWEDMAYQYVVRVTYDITTATEQYFAPGDGVSGKGTFQNLFRELCVKVKSDDGGGYYIVSVGTGGAEQEFA